MIHTVTLLFPGSKYNSKNGLKKRFRTIRNIGVIFTSFISLQFWSKNNPISSG